MWLNESIQFIDSKFCLKFIQIGLQCRNGPGSVFSMSLFQVVMVYIVKIGFSYFSVGGQLSGRSPTIYIYLFCVFCVCVSTYTQTSLRPQVQNPACTLFKLRWQVLPPNLSLNFVSVELYRECSCSTVMMWSHTWLLLIMIAALLLTPSASGKSTAIHSSWQQAGRRGA